LGTFTLNFCQKKSERNLSDGLPILFLSPGDCLCGLSYIQRYFHQGLGICSADPGVRTFATASDGQESVKYGEGFYNQKVFPLLPDSDNLISGRQIFLNSKPDKETQAFSDKMRFFAKRIDKLRNRIEYLTDDLHRRAAYDPVTKNDVILLPTFETKDMASRQDRKISSETVRSMP